MELHELKIFMMVADELNFRKAAERLAMSQPPVTRTIAHLEEELGVALFTRTTRRVELTVAGLALLKEAREILDRVREAENNVRRIGRMRRAELSVGLTTLAFYSKLPALIWKFRELCPDVKLEFSTRRLDQLLDELDRGKVDLIICEGPMETDAYESVSLARQELGIILPLTHPLARRKTLQLSELAKSTFIMHPRSEAPKFHDAVRALLQENIGDYRVRLRRKGEGCPLLVAMGQGILLATRATGELQTPGTCFVPLRGPKPEIEFAAAWRREKAQLPLLSFQAFLKEESHLKEGCPQCLMGLGGCIV